MPWSVAPRMPPAVGAVEERQASPMGSHGASDSRQVAATPPPDLDVNDRRVSGTVSCRGHLAAAVGPCLVDVGHVSYRLQISHSRRGQAAP